MKELVNHEIFAGNYLIGESLFLTLKLPADWELAAGVSRPDIVANHERRSKLWVANGDGWYVIYKPEQRWALEVAIHIRLPSKKSLTNAKETWIINGHIAKLVWKNKRRGLPWRRHDVSFMILDFDCPYSDRHIQLEFSGWCPREAFEEILQAIRHARCH